MKSKVFSPGEVILGVADPAPPFLVRRGTVALLVPKLSGSEEGHGPLAVVSAGALLLPEFVLDDQSLSKVEAVALSSVVLDPITPNSPFVRQAMLTWFDQLYESAHIRTLPPIHRVAWLVGRIASGEIDGDGHGYVRGIASRPFASAIGYSRDAVADNIKKLEAWGYVERLKPMRLGIHLRVLTPQKLVHEALYGELPPEGAARMKLPWSQASFS